MALNIPEAFVYKDVYASFGPYQILPKLFALSISDHQHSAANYHSLCWPSCAVSGLPWTVSETGLMFRLGFSFAMDASECFDTCYRTADKSFYLEESLYQGSIASPESSNHLVQECRNFGEIDAYNTKLASWGQSRVAPVGQELCWGACWGPWG